MQMGGAYQCGHPQAKGETERARDQSSLGGVQAGCAYGAASWSVQGSLAPSGGPYA